jgi:hypothetical protein
MSVCCLFVEFKKFDVAKGNVGVRCSMLTVPKGKDLINMCDLRRKGNRLLIGRISECRKEGRTKERKKLDPPAGNKLGYNR